MSAEILGGSFDPAAHFRPRTLPHSEGRQDAGVTGDAGEYVDAGAQSFRGRIDVSGFLSVWPEQNFTVVCPAHNLCSVQSALSYPLPALKIDLEVDSDRRPKAIRSVQIDPADNTAEAELYYTRVEAALIMDGLCRLRDLEKGTDFKFKVRAPETDWFILRSMLCRKLKFIENIFGVRFAVPESATAGDARRIEMVFRGITEGEFTMRRSELSLPDYSPAPGGVDSPPFTAPGSFVHISSAGIQIYGRTLDVGPVEVRLERAVATNKRLINRLRDGELQAADLRLLVFDHQVVYRFHDYVGRVEETRARLNSFREELLREEPAALVDLLSARIENEVSAEEARKIAVGWLQFNAFPDRFWPQSPAREGGVWRVPVWVTYPDARGALVEDLFVDAKTGRLTATISVAEMLERGRAVAESLLRDG
jgi:hypothetical protein